MEQASEMQARLLRLLRIDRRELPEELRRLARLMASKGDKGRFDWADAAWLLLGTSNNESVRRQIARDYYRTEFKLNRNEDKAA